MGGGTCFLLVPAGHSCAPGIQDAHLCQHGPTLLGNDTQSSGLRGEHQAWRERCSGTLSAAQSKSQGQLHTSFCLQCPTSAACNVTMSVVCLSQFFMKNITKSSVISLLWQLWSTWGQAVDFWVTLMRSPLNKQLCSSVTPLINESSISAAYSSLNPSPSSPATSTICTSFPCGGENQSGWLTGFWGKCGVFQGQSRSKEQSLVSKAPILKSLCLNPLPFIRKSLLGTYWYDAARIPVTGCSEILTSLTLGPKPSWGTLIIALSMKFAKRLPLITHNYTKTSHPLQDIPLATAINHYLHLTLIPVPITAS